MNDYYPSTLVDKYRLVLYHYTTTIDESPEVDIHLKEEPINISLSIARFRGESRRLTVEEFDELTKHLRECYFQEGGEENEHIDS